MIIKFTIQGFELIIHKTNIIKYNTNIKVISSEENSTFTDMEGNIVNYKNEMKENAIKDIKGQNIISLDLRNIEEAICKYFIICTGSSSTHVSAIERNIKKRVPENPWKTEGKTNINWILMDYIDIVVHIFNQEKREFYNLEDLWGDARITKHRENTKIKTA